MRNLPWAVALSSRRRVFCSAADPLNPAGAIAWLEPSRLVELLSPCLCADPLGRIR